MQCNLTVLLTYLSKAEHTDKVIQCRISKKLGFPKISDINLSTNLFIYNLISIGKFNLVQSYLSHFCRSRELTMNPIPPIRFSALLMYRWYKSSNIKVSSILHFFFTFVQNHQIYIFVISSLSVSRS
uniref:Pentatricopeptide repeat-containing protein n=1 Tax=Strongyloides papillosus TaxID=174720 RepID=A0A0N5BII4_STREA